MNRIHAFGAAFVRSRPALQLATGLFLVTLALFVGRVRIELMVEGARTTGRIVAYEARLMPRSGTLTTGTTAFMPVVEFEAGTRAVRFKDWLGSSVAGARDARVPVLYRRADPSVGMIDRRVGNWLPWAPILALGLFLVLDAVRASVARRSRRAFTPPSSVQAR